MEGLTAAASLSEAGSSHKDIFSRVDTIELECPLIASGLSLTSKASVSTTLARKSSSGRSKALSSKGKSLGENEASASLLQMIVCYVFE